MPNSQATRKIINAMSRDNRVRLILHDICALTKMGFAAVSRIDDGKWIAVQVADQAGLGIVPGDEIPIETIICNAIKETGRQVVIDHVAQDRQWRDHPAPALYGFQSYVSFPIFRDNGKLFGTMCALDAEPRTVSGYETLAILAAFAKQIETILSELPDA
jgi:GAF domain-containing protein